MGIFDTSFAKSFRRDASWHIQFSWIQVAASREVYDVDLFDTERSKIQDLKSQGIVVICYFSAGTREDWRPDKNLFSDEVMGDALSDWEGENWIDVRNRKVRQIMQSRIILAKYKWCDGIDPDNVNGHENATGFSLTKNDLLHYNRFLVREAHVRGMMIWLKNSQSLIAEMGKKYDFFINESCYSFDECSAYESIAKNKPILIMEYEEPNPVFCQNAKEHGFVLQYFSRALDTKSQKCP